MTSYDPRGQTWDKWCAFMAELFAANQLGTLPEDRWRDWANMMAMTGNFTRSGVPDSRGFDTWQAWAEQLVGIINVEGKGY